MLPAIIAELPGLEEEDWQTRVVPNKYPALSAESDASRHLEGIYLSMPGYGRHEVIIESPRHNHDLAQMSIEEVGVVVESYHRRYVGVMAEHANMMAILFRNHGPQAGTSLLHPHSQLVVTGLVPRHVRWRETAAQRYFDEWGRCVLCDIVAFEVQDRRRVILENETFLVFVPFAAEVPFELWIVPKRHQADFGAVSDEQKADLASALREALGRLHSKLHDPDYNYVIHSAAQCKSGEPQLHWYLQIQPRLTTQAGFEIGSGMRINPSLPEEDAQFLNDGAAGAGRGEAAHIRRKNSVEHRQDNRSDVPVGREGNEDSPMREEGSFIIVAGNTAWNDDADVQEIMGTQRGTGRTYQPQKAVEEGLSYTPPRDPPTVPSQDNPQGSEMAAGFASSMESTDPDVQVLPDRIDRADLEIQEEIGPALDYNSETAHLDDISALVNRGVVSLYGTVPSEDDIALVYAIVSDLEGVARVISYLEVAA
jgi:UDPglucose--hexose-1-phosphate uridylyltransferase